MPSLMISIGAEDYSRSRNPSFGGYGALGYTAPGPTAQGPTTSGPTAQEPTAPAAPAPGPSRDSGGRRHIIKGLFAR